MSLEGAAGVLSKCVLFKDFSETGVAILASIAAERQVPAGSPLFVEGMASDALFVVKSGTLRIAVKRDRDQKVIGYLGTGQALGQVSLLGGPGARLVTATADGASEVVEIRQRDFQRLQTQKPQACLKLMMAIATQLGELLGENRDVVVAGALSR